MFSFSKLSKKIMKYLANECNVEGISVPKANNQARIHDKTQSEQGD